MESQYIAKLLLDAQIIQNKHIWVGSSEGYHLQSPTPGWLYLEKPNVDPQLHIVRGICIMSRIILQPKGLIPSSLAPAVSPYC